MACSAGSTAFATDFVRITVDGLPRPPKAMYRVNGTVSILTGMPTGPKAQRLQAGASVDSVAAVDGCTAPVCVYYETTGISGGSTVGTFHFRLNAGNEPSLVLGPDGENMGLLLYYVTALALQW